MKRAVMRLPRAFVPAILAVIGFSLLVPAAATAQSRFVGRVTDATGAVLPGVTIEAASPALIERLKSAVSDGEGRYTIVDLRPGDYTVTFKLLGFATVIREQVQLPADFSMTMSAEMKLGGMEETITVSGASATVDVSQAQRSQVMDREALDTLPTGHSLQARAALVQMVVSIPDVGGSQNMDQHNMRVAGTEDNEATVYVDGMMLNSNSSDGASQYYFNEAMAEQVTIQTSGVDAETSAGGVRINLVPREGGNRFKGTFYYDKANRHMMSSNLTPRLQGLGVDSVNRIWDAYEVNGSFGGPIVKDRLWFFFTGHRKTLERVVLGSFYPDGSPGIDDNLIHAAQVRLTYQITQQHKLAVFYDDNNKVEYHTHSAGEDILTVSQTRGVNKKGPRYAAQVKWTGTFTSSLLAEAGWGTNRVDYVNRGLEGLRQDRPAFVRTCPATPCLSFDAAQVGRGIDPWYTTTSNFDPEAKLQRWGNSTDDWGKVPQRYFVTAKTTWVTGRQTLKVGVQNSFGPENKWRINNADIRSVNYRSGVPESIDVWNTPTVSSAEVSHDIGVYAQESLKLGRLTINPGVRLEWFETKWNNELAPAGRFVPARSFDEHVVAPSWLDVSPRFGIVWDVFGTSKTALKFDAGKYVHNLTLSLADRYNPMFETFENRLWADCYRDLANGSGCSSANPYSTNGDRIVQDWEIGPGTANFGARTVNQTDPNLKRDWYLRTGLSIDHELFPNVGVSAGWYRTNYRDMRTYQTPTGTTASTFFTRNRLRSLDDYVAFQVANPLAGYEGQKITVYNLRREKLPLVDNLDTNVPDTSGQIYNGFVFSGTARLKTGNVFGGVTFERSVNRFCDSYDNPNQFRFCDTYGGSGEADALAKMSNAGPASVFTGKLPYQTTFKFGGDYPLPYGVQLSGALRVIPGVERIITWSVPAAAFTAAGLTRTQTVNVRLNEPGSDFYARTTIVDLGVGKWFNLPNHLRMKVGANLYNLLNPDTVTGQTNTFGPQLGAVTSVILGRFWRANMQVEW